MNSTGTALDPLPPSAQHGGFLDSVKAHLPSYVSAVFSGIFMVLALVFNYGGHSQHTQDVQADQERRIELLEKESATRREVDEIKKTVDRIENKIDNWMETVSGRK